MKQVRLSVFSLVVLILIIVLVGCPKAPHIKPKPEIIEYNPPYGKVTFTHKKHAETLKIDCVKCHHEMKGKKPGEAVQGCKNCHKAKAEVKAISAKDAYHKDCKGCHEEAKKANKPAGPTGCTQCHVKAK